MFLKLSLNKNLKTTLNKRCKELNSILILNFALKALKLRYALSHMIAYVLTDTDYITSFHHFSDVLFFINFFLYIETCSDSIISIWLLTLETDFFSRDYSCMWADVKDKPFSRLTMNEISQHEWHTTEQALDGHIDLW